MKSRAEFLIGVAAILLGLVFALPAHADITWTEQVKSGLQDWRSIASSSDGTKLAAAVYDGHIYTSDNSGVDWTSRADWNYWTAIASSSDGATLAATAKNGYIYTSVNSGHSWAARMTDCARNWTAIASSSDGAKLAAVVKGEYIYTSVNSGQDWEARMTDFARNWTAVASSSDGAKLAAVVRGGYVYTSVNSGQDWVARLTDLARDWTAIAYSSDGTTIVAAYESGYIYVSTDSGENWERVTEDTTRYWTSVASSSGGTTLAATVDSGYIYVSTDSGATWKQSTTDPTQRWTSIVSSSDGTKLAATVSGSYIWTGQSSTLVDLISFGATSTTSDILLRWETGSELENAGFHLWRAGAKAGHYSRITGSLIPAEGDPLTGAAYAYRDSDVNLGKRYYYKLEDVDNTGAGTYHGPVSATVGVIRPISPKSGAVLASGAAPCFRWKSVPYNRFKLQFSKKADFRSGVVTLPGTGTWLRNSSFTPGKAKWKRIAGLAAKGKPIYWRVAGKEPSGGASASSALKLFIEGDSRARLLAGGEVFREDLISMPVPVRWR